MPHQVGYCCINTDLRNKNITTSRSMIKRTFEQKGLKYVSELALQNAEDLVRILVWNANHDINVFRVSSGIFPWGTEYNIEELPNSQKIIDILGLAGVVATQSGQRITSHPDHFVKLASTKDHVVQNSIKDLELHSLVFDYMGLDTTPYNAINIHVGMNYSNEVASRWIKAYNMLSDNCKSRLVVENDDKPNSFSVRQLYEHIHSYIGIPITFDYFHHTFHPDGLSTKDAAMLAASTWPAGIKPLFHYSESKNLNENVDGNPRAHADFVFNKIDDFGLDLDIDLEAKAKEKALFKYRRLV